MYKAAAAAGRMCRMLMGKKCKRMRKKETVLRGHNWMLAPIHFKTDWNAFQRNLINDSPLVAQ